MNYTRKQFLASTAFTVAAWMTGCKKTDPKDANVLKVGFFPNITHAQGLVGFHETTTKAEQGWFESRLGVKIQWIPFNAGPSAVEGLEIGTVDLTYVGPNPVINGYCRRKGEEVRVLTGSARGGVALVVQGGSGLKNPADFRGKKVATPQLGNTQDVAARAWLKNGGLNITQTGGDAKIIPTLNPDQLDLFKTKQLDAVWTVEPWVSRLELEAGGEIALMQDNTFITLLAASVKSVNTKADLLKKFVAAHEELTKKIVADEAFAKAAVSAAILKATTRPIPPKLLDHAWPRLKFTTALDVKDFEAAMADAKSVGLLPVEAPLDRLFTKL